MRDVYSTTAIFLN